MPCETGRRRCVPLLFLFSLWIVRTDTFGCYTEQKTVKKQPSGTQDSPAVESELDYGSAFLSTLKQKLGGVAAASQDASQPDAPDPGLDKEVDASVTAEAMEGPRKKEVGAGGAPKDSEAVGEDGEGVGEGVGEVDELVLVVHGYAPPSFSSPGSLESDTSSLA